MKLLNISALLLLLFLIETAPSFALQPPDRIALIVGNGNYADGDALPNASLDANAVSEGLKSAGFEVFPVATDVGKVKLEEILSDFRKSVAKLPNNGIALIYYAGHGFQYQNQDVLWLADSTSSAWSSTTLQVADLVDTVSVNQNATGVVFIDACRDPSHFESEGLKVSSFSPLIVPANVVVQFSTSPGSIAADGVPSYFSPFARAVLTELGRNGEPIALFLPAVSIKVQSITGKHQLPVTLGTAAGALPLNDKPSSFADQLVYDANLESKNGTDVKIWSAKVYQAASLDQKDALESMGFGYFKSGNLAEGERLYKRAGEFGNEHAVFNLGIIKLYGTYGVPVDANQGIALLEEASKAGYGEATYTLGYLYANGKFVPKDINKAIYYYGLDKYADDCCSAINLGYIYERGNDVPQDLDKAEELFKLAVEKGNSKGWAGLSRVEQDRGNFPQAAAYANKGIAVNEPGSMSEASWILWNKVGTDDARQQAYDLDRNALAIYLQDPKANEDFIAGLKNTIGTMESGEWWARTHGPATGPNRPPSP